MKSSVKVWVRACGHLFCHRGTGRVEKTAISEEEATALILAGAEKIKSSIQCWDCYMKSESQEIDRKYRDQDETSK